MNTKAMYALTYGLFVLSAEENGKHNACISNTVQQVTSQPNRISVAVNKANLTCEMIARTGRFTASILSEAADFDLFKRFGYQSGRDTDKFAGFTDCKLAENGTAIITRGTNAYISGTVAQSVDLGTHMLYIADVTEMEVLSDTPSVTYAFYSENIKPKPQKVGETADGQTIWR
ncbi:MAG: flavin reductase, partial [Clostridia bacterium]|nr:flavin reductase [Clostridia bacterium]